MKLHSQLLTSLVILAIAGAQNVNAQDADSLKRITGGKNTIKVNLTSIPLGNYSFQYERAIGKKVSLAVGYNFRKESELPFKSSLESLIDDEDTWDQLGSLKTGFSAITPEIRFYMGKGVCKGFYLAPFAKFATYKAKLPSFEYTFEENINGQDVSKTEQIPLAGDIKTVTGGLMLGAQWKLSKLFYLDWWILGPNYGTSKGSISGTKSLTEDEQKGLSEELEDLEIPLVDSKTTVDSKGARMEFSGPWAGARAGISLGIRF